jgi:hypothetical protein
MVVKISDMLQSLINDLAKQAEEEQKKRKKNEQVQWMMPPKAKWSGDLWDWPGIYEAFSQEQPNDEFLTALDPDAGNSGDLIMANHNIDYLSAMERAFRARHTMTFPRNVAHHCSRRKGQGDKEGPLKYGVIDYMRNLDKISSKVA